MSACVCRQNFDDELLLICDSSAMNAIKSDIGFVSARRMEFRFISIANDAEVYLGENFLDNLKVKKIRLYVYNLKTIHNQVFRNQKDSLEAVEFYVTKSSGIPTDIFDPMTKLTSYDFVMSPNVEVVPEEIFEGLACSSTLTSINFADNNIKSVKRRAFIHLINLQSLILYGNKLKVLPADGFPQAAGKLSLLNLK